MDTVPFVCDVMLPGDIIKARYVVNVLANYATKAEACSQLGSYLLHYNKLPDFKAGEYLDAHPLTFDAGIAQVW